MARIFKVPVDKAIPGTTIDVDLDSIPDDYIDYIYVHGMTAIINAGKTTKAAALSGITKLSDADKAKAYARSMAISEKNLADLYAGKFAIKKSKGKKASDADGLPKAVQTEARRIAREMVRDDIRAAGGKVSHYSAADITKVADQYIADNPAIVEKAQANLAAVKDTAAHMTKVNIGDFIKPDPKKVAEAEANKQAAAERKAAKPLSAKQAGMTTTKAKPATKVERDNNSFLAALKADTTHSAHKAH